MRRAILIMTGLLGSASGAFADSLDNCIANFSGEYTNSLYNGPYSYQRAYVKLIPGAQNKLELEINIPCGSKLIPAKAVVEVAECTFQPSIALSYLAGKLQILGKGTSQCDLGADPKFVMTIHRIEIDTGRRIRVPNFNGTYVFERN